MPRKLHERVLELFDKKRRIEMKKQQIQQRGMEIADELMLILKGLKPNETPFFVESFLEKVLKKKHEITHIQHLFILLSSYRKISKEKMLTVLGKLAKRFSANSQAFNSLQSLRATVEKYFD